MYKTEFYIQLLVDELRQSACWVLSDKPIVDTVAKQLFEGYLGVRDMQISESPLFVFLGDSGGEGRISETAYVVSHTHVRSPVRTFLINEPFLALVSGECFFEQLQELDAFFYDEGDDEVQLMFSVWAVDKNMHCVAVRG